MPRSGQRIRRGFGGSFRTLLVDPPFEISTVAWPQAVLCSTPSPPFIHINLIPRPELSLELSSKCLCRNLSSSSGNGPCAIWAVGWLGHLKLSGSPPLQVVHSQWSNKLQGQNWGGCHSKQSYNWDLTRRLKMVVCIRRKGSESSQVQPSTNPTKYTRSASLARSIICI